MKIAKYRNYSFTLFSNIKMMATKIKLSITDQIKEALDGRTQRWLALKIQMPEDTLSKKMLCAKGYEFTSEDLDVINQVLGSSIRF